MSFLPPYLLRHIAESNLGEASSAAHSTLLNPPEIHPVDSNRQSAIGIRKLVRTIYDAHHSTRLPGILVRNEGQQDGSDEDVNNAYKWLGVTYDFYKKVFDYSSVDGRGYPLNATIHYDRNYDNAFWNGRQMVFGDGDHTIFRSFTSKLDVVAHELTHGVDQFNAGLIYADQSGALNESVSDVFGMLVSQWYLNQTAMESDWIVGKGIFESNINGVGIRSMSHPGTAYDDLNIGKDQQVGSMDEYKHFSEFQDNGGVHVNSGIPNRAFYLVATAIGGYAWESAGQIWWETLTSSQLPRDADFAIFAQTTITVAEKLYGYNSVEVKATQNGWQTVGVLSENPADRV